MKGRWSLIEHDGKPMTLRELSEISGVNYNTLRKRWHEGVRGEELVRPVVRKPPGFILFCAYCENEFHHHWRKAKFCSQSCARKAHGHRLSRSDIESFARNGTTATYACRQLGVTLNTFSSALKRYGLYQVWQRSRYVKCASLKVGNTSATTASGEAISPSVG